MSIKKFRWSKVYESSEEELHEILGSRNLHAERVEVKAIDDPMQQRPPLGITVQNDTVFWCAEGSFYLADEQSKLSVQPGDAAAVTAGSEVTITPGLTGYVYYASS